MSGDPIYHPLQLSPHVNKAIAIRSNNPQIESIPGWVVARGGGGAPSEEGEDGREQRVAESERDIKSIFFKKPIQQ